MKESDYLQDIKHLVHSNAVQGEIQIGHFRFFVIFAAIFMVLAMCLETGLISPSEQADLFSLSTALIYNILLFWLLKRKQYYKRYLGFISSTIDIALVSTAIYFARYGINSSVVTIVASGAFAVYLPIILFSLRRHDPLNSLYTGCLAGIIYFGMILIMAKEGAFGVVLRSGTGLILMHDILNECTKTAFLIVSGVLGYITSKNYDFLLYKGIRKEKENENLKFLFGRFVAPELVEKIVNKEIPLTGEKRVISVMFLDIKNFTSLSEKIEPKLLVQVLNEFFKCSERIISKYKGFIDKFIGDAIMVEFGAPLYSENHRERAINCAIELRNAVENISHKIKDLGVDWSLEIGIGINSGEAILGIVGAENRIGYTALGDTVNVASRLEKLTRELKKDIIIGKSVYIDKFKDLTEGPISVKLKGKSKEMVVYPLKKNLIAPISDSILL